MRRGRADGETDSEAGLEPLLDDAPCGFVVFADDGAIRAANRTLVTLLGMDRADLIGRHIEHILAIGSRIFYQTHLFPLLRLQGHAEEIFLLLRSSTGEDVAVLANGVRRQRDGEWVTDCVFLRLQERRKYEDALLSAKKSAEEARAIADKHSRDLAEANRAKSAFLATMSHELRTPLNAIGGYVQLLQMGIHGVLTEGQREAIDRVERSQRHLLRLINDLLNLARIEAGRVEYTLQSISVSDIVQTALPMIEPQMAARHLRQELEIATNLTVYADREKVEQILLNLLSNATKFTPAGGRVSVEAGIDPIDSARVQIRVRDTGVGIPADRLAQVFEPFVQIDPSEANRRSGTGLGLAISRDLARGMGGDLRAESEVGVGSCFILALRRPAPPNDVIDVPE